MSKAIRMARLSAKGGVSLFLGLIISTLISAVGLIVVLRMLTPQEYGLVTIALIPPAFIGMFRDWGVNSAMIKYLAQYRSENRTIEAKNVLVSGLIFELTLGVLLSLVSFSLSNFLATHVFHRPEMGYLIEIASITILAGSLLTASQSAFIGFERMEFNSLTMICQSCMKSLLAPLLVLFGYGALGVVLGHTIAFLVACITGIVVLYFLVYRKIHVADNNDLNLKKTLKSMLKYGLPLFISAILSGLLLQFINFMMAIYCSDPLIGNYQAAVNFTVIITFFTTPIATVLFPAFSKLNAEKEKEILRIVFQSSVKYAAFLTVPATSMIMVLSKPLVFTLFGETWSQTPLFLALYAIMYLYTGLGNLSLGNFLNGQGKTKITMFLTLITLSIGLPLSLLLIPRFHILGLIVTSLVSGIPSLALGLHWIKRDFGITIDWFSSAKIFLSSGIAAAVTYLIVLQLSFPNWVELVVGGTVFIIIYLITIPIIGIVNQGDINNLKGMLSELGPFSRFFNLLLNLVEKLLTIFSGED